MGNMVGLLPFLLLSQSQQRLTRDTRLTSSQLAALFMQGVGGKAMMRERWSESDILALPPEEPSKWDRKSGRLFDDQVKFLDSMAKVVSAMANSGGGSIILGVEDDGTPAGVKSHIGRQSMKDWLEQQLPNLTDYPLSNFRVHTVERAVPSLIPADAVVIVIDIGDSPLAPHQNKGVYPPCIRRTLRV